MEEDRFVRITLRIPKSVHEKVSAAADQASHSTNAEIVQRLEASFEAVDVSALLAQAHEFERQAARARIKAAEERANGARYLLVLQRIAHLIPEGGFKSFPEVEGALKELRHTDNDLFRGVLEQMISDLKTMEADREAAIKSGALRVVSDEENAASKAARKKRG